MSQPELRNCPFCGEDHFHLEQDNHEFFPWLIHSVDGRFSCFFSMRFKTQEEAIKTWNERSDGLADNLGVPEDFRWPHDPKCECGNCPAPRVGDDVVEAMSRAHAAHDNAGMYTAVARWKQEENLAHMQAAITAAEAMGYTLTPSERLATIRENIRQLFKDPMCIGDALKIPESMRSDIWRMVDDVFDAPPAGERK